jgi:hypothetical protein
MAHWKSFSVRCNVCGHSNRPAKSPREGIRKVLTGEFRFCHKCNSEFTKIVVPNRPLVEEVRLGLNVAPRVEIVGYNDCIPKAQGFIS